MYKPGKTVDVWSSKQIFDAQNPQYKTWVLRAEHICIFFIYIYIDTSYKTFYEALDEEIGYN